jgi:hypothetical protein
VTQPQALLTPGDKRAAPVPSGVDTSINTY